MLPQKEEDLSHLSRRHIIAVTRWKNIITITGEVHFLWVRRRLQNRGPMSLDESEPV